MAKFNVVISDLRFPDAGIETKLLETEDCELSVFYCNTEEEMIAACENSDAILLNLAPCGRKVIERLKYCRIISRYGVGIDNIDIQACTEKGILVANVPDYCAEDVSDMALALLLSCLRRITMKDKMIRKGMWNIHAEHMQRIEGKNLSLIGFGRIAQAFLRKMQGFHLGKIYIYDPYVSREAIQAAGAEKVELREALCNGDFISLHLPLNESTKGIIGAEQLEVMKNNAIIINTSRGALIDERALIAALKEHRIAGAGLDTFTVEPLEADNDLLKLDNCVLTDHSGFNTEEAMKELRIKAVKNVIDILQGNIPKYSVNKIL